ncbi:hypothetical protein GEMRC1_001684 [Eukaryota sp. GEM-RC1]
MNYLNALLLHLIGFWAFCKHNVYVFSLKDNSLLAKIPLLRDVTSVQDTCTISNPDGILVLISSNAGQALLLLSTQSLSLSIVTTFSRSPMVTTISSICANDTLILYGTEGGSISAITVSLLPTKISYSSPVTLSCPTSSASSKFVFADGKDRNPNFVFVSSIQFLFADESSNYYMVVGYSFGFFQTVKLSYNLGEFNFGVLHYSFVSEEAELRCEEVMLAPIIPAVLSFTYLPLRNCLYVTGGTHWNSEAQLPSVISRYSLDRVCNISGDVTRFDLPSISLMTSPLIVSSSDHDYELYFCGKGSDETGAEGLCACSVSETGYDIFPLFELSGSIICFSPVQHSKVLHISSFSNASVIVVSSTGLFFLCY